VPSQIGLFDQWWGGAWADRNAINQNANELAALEGNTQMLQDLVRRQAQDILRMRAMFAGLVQVLEAKNLVAESELQAAIQATWEQLDPAAHAAAHAPAGMALATCIRCTQQVAASATVLTGDGPVCDACAARM
jgi:hypothetical protein